MMAVLELEKGKKYVLQLGKGVNVKSLYNGAGDDPHLAKLWPHEFVTPFPFGISASQTNEVFSIRVREGGLSAMGDTITLIPDQSGRRCYSNHYSPFFDDTLHGTSREERERLLRKMREAGL